MPSAASPHRGVNPRNAFAPSTPVNDPYERGVGAISLQSCRKGQKRTKKPACNSTRRHRASSDSVTPTKTVEARRTAARSVGRLSALRTQRDAPEGVSGKLPGNPVDRQLFGDFDDADRVARGSCSTSAFATTRATSIRATHGSPSTAGLPWRPTRAHPVVDRRPS